MEAVSGDGRTDALSEYARSSRTSMTALNKETSQTGIPSAAIGKQSRADKCAEVDAKGKKILAQDLLSYMSFKSTERCKILVTVRHEKVKC